jgi:hypothetical protein
MRTAILALLALASCASVPATQRDITPAFQGTWGGPHIGLRVGTLDTLVEFDCAEGGFTGPYLVNDDGRFEWDGTFTRGTGGPVRVGQEPPEVHAVYTGVFRGSGGYMKLQVKLDDGQIIGPFTLERFKDPQLTRCL